MIRFLQLFLLPAAIFLPNTAQSNDCRTTWRDNLNSCAIVLANQANLEMQRAFAFTVKCYEEFHGGENYRRIKNVPFWWPGDGRLPVEHLRAAQDAWEVYRSEECRGRNTEWEASHFRFTGNFCLLRETEQRIRRLHATAKHCRVVSMTGREFDATFPHYKTKYQFITEPWN